MKITNAFCLAICLGSERIKIQQQADKRYLRKNLAHESILLILIRYFLFVLRIWCICPSASFGDTMSTMHLCGVLQLNGLFVIGRSLASATTKWENVRQKKRNIQTINIVGETNAMNISLTSLQYMACNRWLFALAGTSHDIILATYSAIRNRPHTKVKGYSSNATAVDLLPVHFNLTIGRTLNWTLDYSEFFVSIFTSFFNHATMPKNKWQMINPTSNGKSSLHWFHL